MRKFVLIALLSLACLLSLAWPPALALAGPLEAALQARLTAGLGAEVTEEQAGDIATLTAFYEARAYRPIWVAEAAGTLAVTARARSLAQELEAAAHEGLDPADYAAEEIEMLLPADTPQALADLEMRLSLGLMSFASDLASGRVEPANFDPETFVYAQDVDRAAVLQQAAEATDVAALLADFKPRSARYNRTRQALADYRRTAAAGGWQPVPPGETLKLGMTDPRVGPLRARLAVTGDLGEVSDSDLYDAAVETAVRRFQARHGLEVDGMVGKSTLAALNVPVERRIQQLILNLERRRWMADDLGRRFIFVNLADFLLKVVEAPNGAETTVFATRVVVGTPFHRTPVFSGEMTYLEINPFWTVPPDIARKELLPKIKKDPGYLAANDYVLFDGWGEAARPLDPHGVDWTRLRANNFGYKIRQEPGDRNALGRIKFMFPNRFSVYLHDTPSKGLFDRSQRAFSHGCVRVQDPVDLAAVVLEGQDGWDETRIRDTIREGRRSVVPLARKLPVHLAYLTAWVDKDGTVQFREDIYGRDALLAKALLGSGA